MIMTYALLWLVTSAPTCRLMVVPLSRDSGFTYFIATALPDTLRATAGTGPTRYGFTPMSASNPGVSCRLQLLIRQCSVNSSGSIAWEALARTRFSGTSLAADVTHS